VGEQYALPEAVELLRRIRRQDRRGEVVRLCACDPLNLVGTLLPGARIPALAANFVSYRDGLPELPQDGQLAPEAAVSSRS
jgi:ATP-dependent Lhr-like helicase